MQTLTPLALLNLLTVYVVWGSTYLGIRFAITAWPPLSLGVARFAIAGALMLLLARLRGQSLRLDRESAVTCAIAGTLLFTVGNGAVIWAEKGTSSGLVAVIIATVPIWMTLIAWLLGTGPRPSVAVAIALSLGLGGVAVLVVDKQAAVPLGDAAILTLGSLAWAFASVWLGKRQPSGHLLVRSGYQMLSGAAGFAVLALLSGETAALTPRILSPTPLAALLYLVVFGSCVGFLAYAWLVQHLPAHITGTYAFVNPVIAVFLGAVFGERVASGALIAVLLVAVGILLTLRTSARVSSASESAPAEPGVDAGSGVQEA